MLALQCMHNNFNNQTGPIYPLIYINLHVTCVKQSDENLLSLNKKDEKKKHIFRGHVGPLHQIQG